MATRILIVDDDAFNLQLVSKVLSQAGHETITARSGAEALRIVDTLNPDLVILDVMMPEVDGYEVCRRLRRKPATAHLPIMMLTGQETLEEKIKGYEAGADDYMTKPFQPAELQARVKVLLRRAVAVQPEAAKLNGRTIAVFSLRGGVGVSTLAANLATALAQLWGHPSVLVDLALMAGQSALMLNLSPRNTWLDLEGIPPQEIDAEMVNNLLLPHASGAYVLAAPRRAEQSELVTADLVKRVLTLLTENYHYIVLDLPHDFRETTLAGLDAAHEILAVLAPELASIQATASTLQVFETLGYRRDTVHLVLNQTIERRGLAKKDIETALKCPIELVIPPAQDIFVQAINVGVPAVIGAVNTPVGALLEDFAFHLSKEEHRKQRPANPTEAWQRVARRLQQRTK